MADIRLRRQVRDEMIAHAEEDAPHECCGLLIGAGGAIDECVRARNLRASPTTYLLDPAAHIAANRRLRGTGRSVIGVYHSHPGSAPFPSDTDRAEALYPEFIWLIVSPGRSGAAQLAAFRLEGGVVTPLAIVMES